MLKKQNKINKTLVFLIIAFLILIFIFSQMKESQKNIQEDLLFFKIWNIPLLTNQKDESTTINQKTKQYKIKVKKSKEITKNLELLETVDRTTLIKEKIAPGTKGNFEIILTSNDTLNYKIYIKGKNEKPKNFIFKIQEEQGKIEKGETKKVNVTWEWPYEINEEENNQDTKDGTQLKIYNFEICIIGE